MRKHGPFTTPAPSYTHINAHSGTSNHSVLPPLVHICTVQIFSDVQSVQDVGNREETPPFLAILPSASLNAIRDTEVDVDDHY